MIPISVLLCGFTMLVGQIPKINNYIIKAPRNKGLDIKYGFRRNHHIQPQFSHNWRLLRKKECFDIKIEITKIKHTTEAPRPDCGAIVDVGLDGAP